MDVTGQRFGKLTVLRCLDEKPGYFSKYLCRCDCGNEITIPYYGFFRGRTSCGCDKVRDDLTGKRIGKLTVEGLVRKDDFFFATIWKCRCDCGREVTYSTLLLKNGIVSSCGECRDVSAMSGADLARANRGEVEGTNTFLLRSALDGVLYENNTSGVRGVYYHAADQRYWATIVFKGKRINVGQYKDFEKAKEARKKAEQMLYGGFLDYYEADVKASIDAGNEQAAAEMVESFIRQEQGSGGPESQGSRDPESQELETNGSERQEKRLKCLICGKPVPAGRYKYCSNECGQAALIRMNKERRSRKEVLYCEVCGKPIPSDRTRYCSDACQAVGLYITREHSNQRGVAEGRYKIVCADCGRTIMVASYKSYRCPECQEKARKIQNDASKARAQEGKTRKIGSAAICESCGKEYVVKGATQRYCPLCSAIQVQQKTAESPKRTKKKETKVICAICGKEFVSYANHPPKCCSPECNKEYRHQYYARRWAEGKR